MNINRFLAGLSIMMICAGQVSAQEQPTLKIGDPVPSMKYSKWLQGPKPITVLDPNKLYVIEFWATWCGPCIQAMPHLSELAKKYAGKIDFIGCDVWENLYGGPKDQEFYLPKVTRFVQDQYKLGRLTYNVIMDNTAETMGKTWLKAAGQSGIPSSYVIEKGRVAWIGHPVYLDSILVAIIDGKYNMNEEKIRAETRARKNAAINAGPNAAIKAYKAAEAGQDYNKALQLMDTAIARYPEQDYMFVMDRFMLLLNHFSEDKALAYGRELQKENLAGQVLIANLSKESDLSQKVNEFAAEAVKGWNIRGAKVLDIQAGFQAKAGHFKEAAETELRAIDSAKAEKDNPAMTESVISDMQKKADEYKQKAAPGKKAIKLDVGDKAPELRYAQWLKGTPVKSFDADRIYVVEFWATWCGPCIGQMPHLSKVAKEFQKDVTVIGVNIWEGSHDKNPKPYETFLPKVAKFVNSMGNNMAYNVMSDNNAEFMSNNWMKAAGEEGIPCTFLIRDGIIQWIGHPYVIDSMIHLVQSGKYDVAAERKKRVEARTSAASNESNKLGEIMAASRKAIDEKEYDKALKIFDDAIASDSAMAGTLGFFKFQLLLEHYSEERAMSFARQWQATKPGYVGSTGVVIANKEGLSKDTYLFGIELLNTLFDTPQPPSLVYKFIASAYANMGDMKMAIQKQGKAVESAKQALKENKYPGFVLPETVKELEDTLAKYKAGKKATANN